MAHLLNDTHSYTLNGVTCVLNDICDRVEISGVDRYVFVKGGHVHDGRWLFSIRHFSEKLVAEVRRSVETQMPPDADTVAECANVIVETTLNHAGIPFHAN